MSKLLLIWMFNFSLIAQAQDITDDVEIEKAKQSEVAKIKSGLYESVMDDVYVELYLARLVRARMELKQEEALGRLHQSSLVRQRRLLEQNATSRQEYEEVLSRVENSKARALALKSMIVEKRAMFNIAIDRVTIGLDMPICADLR